MDNKILIFLISSVKTNYMNHLIKNIINCFQKLYNSKKRFRILNKNKTKILIINQSKTK